LRKSEETKYERYNKKRPVLSIRVNPVVRKEISKISKKRNISVNKMLEPVLNDWLIEQE
jgi:predicted HicB family RNase H-like nuclease